MVEQFFCDPHVVARLRRRTPLGEGLDELAAYLHRRGYALVSAQDYLRGAAHLGYWMGIARIQLAALTEDTIARFLEGHMPRCRCPVPHGLPLKNLHAGLRHLLEVLREAGRVPARPASPRSAADILVDEYQQHLRHVQGATERTLAHYSRHAREFLAAEFGTCAVDLRRLSPRDVIAFIESHAVRWRPKTTKLLATSLRSFLKFMQVRGLCDGRLVSAVPTIPEWTLSRLPKVLTEEQLRTLFSAFDRHTAVGRRDHAIAICLCHLALRAGEVAELRIDDIDWRSGTVQIAGKSRRTSLLPLPTVVGRAIAQYLRHGRPPTRERHVFVRHLLPVGGRIDANTVRAVIRRAFERTGIQVPSKGTHALRQTAATRMVRAGATLKEVADVLRHRSVDTTAIYTKVDLPRLAEVALPWPEVQP